MSILQCWSVSEGQNQLDCSHCERSITQDRLAYILENRLMVNTDAANIATAQHYLAWIPILHRCFDFQTVEIKNNYL